MQGHVADDRVRVAAFGVQVAVGIILEDPPDPACLSQQNVADFAAERDLVLVFILNKNLPAAGGQAAALARILDRRAEDNPGSYLGHHWPATD